MAGHGRALILDLQQGRQEGQVESDPRSLCFVLSFWIHNDDNRISNPQSAGVSWLITHLQHIREK